jgi:hypothetical protein
VHLKRNLSVVGFTSEVETAIIAALQHGYAESPTAKALVDAWLDDPDHSITVTYTEGACRASPGLVQFDPALTAGVSCVGTCETVRRDLSAALFHTLILALAEIWGEQTAGSQTCGATLSERVLDELGIPRQFASLTQETLILGKLNYQNRWCGSPRRPDVPHAEPESNVVYFRLAPATLSELCGGVGSASLHPPPRVPVQPLFSTLEMELTSDLLAHLPIDLESLGRSRHNWLWVDRWGGGTSFWTGNSGVTHRRD